MNYLRALPWAQIGSGVQASVLVDFATDVAWQIAIGGSLGSDYYEALSVDIDCTELAAGVVITLEFNQVTFTAPAGAFRTYNLTPHQRYMTVRSSAGAPNIMRLGYYPIRRPEWR